MRMLMTARKRPGLEPFARLCPATWVSANLSYLRDLDYLESRMQSVGKNKSGKPNQQDEDPDAASGNPRKPRPKGKAKGKGKPDHPSTASKLRGGAGEKSQSSDIPKSFQEDNLGLGADNFVTYDDVFNHAPVADKQFDPLKLMQATVNEFWLCPTALTHFAKASLTGPTCHVQRAQPWPVPPHQVEMDGAIKAQSSSTP